MEKINKNLSIVTVFVVIIVLVTINIIQKFAPIVFHTSVYYCQELLSSLTLHIPKYTTLFATILLSMFILIIITKLLITLFSVFILKRHIPSTHLYSRRLDKLLYKINLSTSVTVKVIESNKLFAYCFGFIHPNIYISSKLIEISSIKELEAVLRHEYYHIKNKDTLIMFFITIIQWLFPFLPIIKDFIHNYRVEQEIRADHYSITCLGDARPLASILKKFLLSGSCSVGFVPAFANEDTLELRIRTITGNTLPIRKFHILNILLSSFSMIVLVGLLLAPVKAVESHIGSKDIMIICLNGSHCAQRCIQQNKSTSMSSSVRFYTSFNK